MSTEAWRPARSPEELAARFPAMNNAYVMDPRANTQVQAALRSERIVRQAWRNLALADTFITGVPAMRARADAAAADFYRRRNADELHYETYDTEHDPDATYEQGVVRIWRVGGNHVDIVRDRWHDSPNRKLTTTSYAAGLLAHEADTHDYWECGCGDSCGLECNVGVAETCGGTTRLLAVDRGTLVLLFRCCWACETALTGGLPIHRLGAPAGR